MTRNSTASIAGFFAFILASLLTSVFLSQVANDVSAQLPAPSKPIPIVFNPQRWGVKMAQPVPVPETTAKPSAEPTITVPVPKPLPNPTLRPTPETDSLKTVPFIILQLRQRKLTLPVQGIQAKALRSTFHERRGSDRLHEAIDILAPHGTPVLAVEDGTVAKLYYSDKGGITIYQFDPAREFIYYYAHLDRYEKDLKEGNQVKKGQVIGYVGTTGNAPKGVPHLHFSIAKANAQKRWWEGTPIDPYEVLK